MNIGKIQTKAVCKILSANDTGETGSHQAGILVPKDTDILSFFPDLNDNVKNPRTILRFEDGSGVFWKFSFIYYNNKKYGGTRNEFRLTGMTAFIRQNNLKTGDKILFRHGEMEKLFISYERHDERVSEQSGVYEVKPLNRIKLGSTWRVISI